MKKIIQACIIVAVVLLTSCSPKYSAHFTHSDYNYSSLKDHGIINHKVNQAYEEYNIDDISIVESRGQYVEEEKSIKSKDDELNSKDLNVVGKDKLTQLEQRPEKEVLTEKLQEEKHDFSRAEKRVLKKELKGLLKAKFEEDAEGTDPVLLIILCFLLPPLAVYLVYDVGTEFWISLILTLLGWLPGVIYSLIVVLS